MGNMNSILVTPEELRTKATNVDNKAGDYYEHYRNLLKDVEEMTSKDWTGDDAAKFRQTVAEFEPDFTKMKELMEEYAAFLRSAAQSYEDTQTDVMRDMEKLRVHH